MSEESKNTDGLQNEEALPNVEFNEADEIAVNLGDGIQVIEGGLENYQDQTPEEEEEDEFNLTFDEIKKHLRAIRRIEAKKDDDEPEEVTDYDVENLTDEDKEKIQEYLQLKERKAIYKFVYNKKTVTDEEVKDLTEEEFVDLTAKAFAKSQHFTYAPKKDFGVQYKKKRQRRNKIAKASRRANR